jgi:hypothetical protein
LVVAVFLLILHSLYTFLPRRWTILVLSISILIMFFRRKSLGLRKLVQTGRLLEAVPQTPEYLLTSFRLAYTLLGRARREATIPRSFENSSCKLAHYQLNAPPPGALNNCQTQLASQMDLRNKAEKELGRVQKLLMNQSRVAEGWNEKMQELMNLAVGDWPGKRRARLSLRHRRIIKVCLRNTRETSTQEIPVYLVSPLKPFQVFLRVVLVVLLSMICRNN